MKIVLIKPRNEALDNYYDLPLGLLQVASAAKKEGYEVKIIDCVLIKNYLEAIEKECKGAFVAGITVNTAQVREAIKISEFIKKRFGLPIVWGGWHPTLFPEQTCADRLVDFVVIKEGDYTFLELIRAIEVKSTLRDVRGIAFKDKDSVVVTEPRQHADLDKLFETDYDLLNMKRYIRNRGGVVSIMYQSSRGCPYRCQFCINEVTKNQQYRAKSAERVLREIEYLVKRYGVNFVTFVDDNTFVDIYRIKEICKGLVSRKLNIRWHGECRVDYFKDNLIDNDFLSLAVESGLSSLTIGAESGSENILEMVDKDINIEQIINSARILAHHKDISPEYSFIIGFPGETREDVVATLDMAKRLRGICPQASFSIGSLRAYPKSKLTQRIIESGLLKEPAALRDWLKEDFLKAYIGPINQPWHFDKKLIANVSYFSRLGYSTLNSGDIKRIIKSPGRWHLLFDIPFIYLAKFRMDHLFFLFTADRFIYKLYKKLRKTVINSLFLNHTY